MSTTPAEPTTQSAAESSARWALLGAMLPPALTCAAFVAGRLMPDSALAVWLFPAIGLEAIVVHAGLLVGIAVFAWPTTRRGHLTYWPLLAAGLSMYGLAALQAGGTSAAVQCALLAFATYGGVLWAPASRRIAVAVETGLRWLIAVVLLTLTFGIAGAPESLAEWLDLRSRLTAGAVYFGLLTAVEATGLYLAVRRVDTSTA